ncbi:hypothetical protein K9N68_24950 [Kovacikia minuta CCNUW1]|uniref:hypothetical protein n=1 Tax=Kovacikia minuta TaxID=2931930 RepID=UPI001CCC1EA1|nr:hypothetical protein [Kovacikia minuta]UBF24876.1 hypothetical protein K9N68_24950 [Kovacikia minuta CCNUW1]
MIDPLLLVARSHHWQTARSSPTPSDFVIAAIACGATLILFRSLPKGLLKRLPWSSLVVLILPYGLFGWLMGVYNLHWYVWLLVGLATIGISVVVSYELGVVGIRALIGGGIVALVGGMVGATVGRVAEAIALALASSVAWFWAVAGARFRLEALGFDPIQTFWVLVIVSWEGLWLGWGVDTFLLPHLGVWLVQLLTS